jgi:hypothetical protein
MFPYVTVRSVFVVLSGLAKQIVPLHLAIAYARHMKTLGPLPIILFALSRHHWVRLTNHLYFDLIDRLA